MSTTKKFISGVLTGLLLSAIMCCVGCEKPHAQANVMYVNPQPNAVCRSNFSSRATSSNVEMHEVCLDGVYYLVTTYDHGVSVVLMNKAPKSAERQ